MLNYLFVTNPGDLTISLIAGMFGLIIGSFLNVVIYRLPIMMQRDIDNFVAEQSGHPLPHKDIFNLMSPRSACPYCGHQISAIENIPVVSYLVLGGACSACKAPISKRYPLVELLTALISFGLIWHFGLNLAGLSSLIFSYFLIALTLIDIDTQLLPDTLTLPLLWGGLLVNIDNVFCSLSSAVSGAMIGYIFLWTIFWIFKLVTGKEGMGYGDFKLLAALGAWCGWELLPAIVLFSSLIGAIVGISLILFAKHDRSVPIPFGPYLAMAGLTALPFGELILEKHLGIILKNAVGLV